MNNCRHGLRGIVSVAWTWSATPLTAAQLYQDSIQMKSQGMKKALLLGGGSWIESGGRDGCRAWQVKVLAPPQAHSPSDSYRFSQWTMHRGKVATLVKRQYKISNFENIQLWKTSNFEKYPTLKNIQLWKYPTLKKCPTLENIQLWKFLTLKIDFPVNFHNDCINFAWRFPNSSRMRRWKDI